MVARKSNTQGERVASLEAAFLAHCENDRTMFTEIKDELKAMRAEMGEMRGSMSDLRSQLGKQKSFFGGVVFIITAVWAVVATLVKFWPWH